MTESKAVGTRKCSPCRNGWHDWCVHPTPLTEKCACLQDGCYTSPCQESRRKKRRKR